MKKDIHPKARIVDVQLTNGDTIQVLSTYSKPKIVLEVDTHNHPAWTGKLSAISTNDNVKSFKNKFSDISF